MKERPILFSAPMILAILDGRKTQTRRIVKPQPTYRAILSDNGNWYDADCINPGVSIKMSYGQPGDVLWVRENWRTWERPEDGLDGIVYAADQAFKPIENTQRAADLWVEIKKNTWRPSIHMPRWASRITLEVTAVRVERLQEISEEDALAEGIDIPKNLTEAFERGEYLGHRNCYIQLWDSINGKTHPWASNPFVWVIEFRRITP